MSFLRNLWAFWRENFRWDIWWKYRVVDDGVRIDERVIREGPARWRADRQLGNGRGAEGWLVLTERRLIFSESRFGRWPWEENCLRFSIATADVTRAARTLRWTDLLPITGRTVEVTCRSGDVLRLSPFTDTRGWLSDLNARLTATSAQIP